MRAVVFILVTLVATALSSQIRLTQYQSRVSHGIHRGFILASPDCAILTTMKAPSLSRSSALVLQVATLLLGLGILALMLWEPHLEGRNAHATIIEIYFKDPFLAYVYIGSLSFFVALYKAFGIFGHVRQNGTFSRLTVETLHSIKRCALVLLGFVAGAAVFVLIFGDGDDRPAGLFMSMLAALGAGGIALTAAFFARALQSALSRADEFRA